MEHNNQATLDADGLDQNNLDANGTTIGQYVEDGDQVGFQQIHGLLLVHIFGFGWQFCDRKMTRR